MVRYFQEEIPIDSLESYAARWLNETRQTVAPRTTQRRLATVRAFSKAILGTRILEDYSAPTPARAVPHPVAEGIAGVEEMCAKAKGISIPALIAMQGMLGMRVSEARSITSEHIDVRHMRVTVRGKGDKVRVLPISEAAWKYIAPAYEYSEANGGPLVQLSDRGARAAITALSRRLGFENDVKSHDLRATVGTELMNRTGNIRVVQEVLGHSSITTTQVYTAVTVDQMREGLDKING